MTEAAIQLYTMKHVCIYTYIGLYLFIGPWRQMSLEGYIFTVVDSYDYCKSP